MRYFAALALAILFSASGWAASTQDVTLGSNPRFVRTADISADTNLDLIVGTDGGIRILEGAANGSFSAVINPANNDFNQTRSIAFGNLNTGTQVDVVVGKASDDQIAVLYDYNATTNDFASVQFINVGVPTTNTAQSVVCADFDGDGLADIACANDTSNQIAVIRRTGSATYAAFAAIGAPNPFWLAVGDINGDGKPDLISANRNLNAISVFLNFSASGTITFGAAQTIAVGVQPSFLDLGDFNADGKLDLAVLVSGAINVLLGNGDGTFRAAIANPVISGSQNFEIADVTDDGILDLVLVTNLGTNVPSIFLLRGIGDGTFGAAAEFQVNGTAASVAVGDFNKDGQPDVAATFGTFGTSVPTVTIRLLDPRPTLSTITPSKTLLQTAPGTPVSVTLTGTNLLAGARVRIGTTTLLSTASTPPTSVTVSIPASLLQAVGRFDVAAFNSDASGNGILSDPLGFSVYQTTLGTLVVTNTLDSGNGSLRKALQDAQPADTVTFDDTVFNLTNSDAATVINVLSELPALDDGGVTIDASNQRVSVNGSGAGSARGLSVVSTNNVIRGLTLVGFARSGVSISGGAKTNTIGGSRSTGTGPNGQGLRIANCGTFGVEISGAGTDGNVVKGCWIGLDSSGLAAQGNLAGVLISGAAKNNTIGGTAAGEANAISGNSFEGVTISDVGTDGNTTISNVVGAAAIATLAEPRSARISSREVDDIPRRGAIGNGSTGVFISKGTQASSLGGITDGTSNTVANNGGNGIEVRTATSRRNASRGNRVGRNQKGGIALFDGSNDGITPPKDDSFAVVARVSSTRVRVRVQGTVSREGSVELFSDPSSQGSVFAVRNNSAAGRFDIEAEVNDGENVTATLTDADGNTSVFQVLGPGLDTDGDGVTDVEEDLAGTNKASASDVPVLGGSVTVDKAQAAVNFAKAGGDSVKLSLRIDLPAGYTPSGSTIGVKFAGVAERLTLVSKGSSAKGPATVKVKGAAGSTGFITFSVKKDLRAALSQGGLVDSTTAGVTLGIPVAVTVDTGTSKTLFSGSVNMLYKAAQGKSGKAAKAK